MKITKIGPQTPRRLSVLQRGYSMVSAALGLAAMVAVGVGGTALYNNHKLDQIAQARGHQIGTGLEQLEQFSRKYQPQLTVGQAIPGVATPTSPTGSELANLGFSIGSFDDTDQPGGKMKFSITAEPAGCVPAKCILALKVTTSGSVLQKGNVSPEFAQRIAGYVPKGAGWSNLATDPTKLAKNGQTIPNPLGSTRAVVVAASWMGSSQASQTVPPVSYEYKSGSCPAGQVGSKEYYRTVTTDKWGVVTRSSWILSSNDCETPPPPPPPPQPPSCANGATNYPTCTVTPPSCSNGATNYPTCTLSPPTCSNGATNYPTCTVTPPGTCSNGATDYPTCTPIACTPQYTNTTTTNSCTGGQVGSITTNWTTNSCTGATTQTGQSGSCACPNGTTWNGAECKEPVKPPPPPKCPDPEPWCRFANGQTGEYNYGTWEWGYTTYAGPTCSVVPDNAWGSCEQDMSGPGRGCTGCPAPFGY